jgi:hypothetical protein
MRRLQKKKIAQIQFDWMSTNYGGFPQKLLYV